MIIKITLFFLGMIIHRQMSKYLIRREIINKINQKEHYFRNILECIKDGKSEFKNRFLHNVYLKVRTKNKTIDIIYFIEKEDIVIIENRELKYTTENVNVEIRKDIINSIKEYHSDEINDIIDLFGIILSKKDFEKNFKINIEKYLKIKALKKEGSFDKEPDFNIDDILDKIGNDGIESLTVEEIKYLDDYSNKI